MLFLIEGSDDPLDLLLGFFAGDQKPLVRRTLWH